MALIVFVFGVATLLAPGAAHAHTGFDSSDPADGSVIGEPVDLVTISFTGEATPVDDQVVALTPDGVLQRPISIETTDDRVFLIRFDPPLVGGQVGIRWHVQAADGHPIEGAFAFTVDAPAAPATTPATVAAPTTVPIASATPTSGSATATIAPETTPPSAPSTVATTIPATTIPVPTAGAAESGDSADDGAAAGPVDDSEPPADTATATLDEFLAVDGSSPGETTATIGRLIGFLGVVIGLGTLAFAGTTLRGLPVEVGRTLAATRMFGIVIAVGAFVEYLGVRRIGGASFASGWTTAPGFATALRIIGGLALAAGLATATTRRQVRPVSPDRSLSAAVVDDSLLRSDDARSDEGADDLVVAWAPDRRSWPLLVGVAAIMASFWFDGHTVSKGFRPLHALVNTVHVAAGAVWAGGVVAMAAIVWSRHRSGRPTRAAELVVRFSRIATISLAAVVVAGGLMAVFVLDTFGELTGTTWGRLLLLKTGAVALAMIGGAFNHFRLLPALEADPDSPELAARLRSTITAEAILLIFVVVVTAWLAAAAS